MNPSESMKKKIIFCFTSTHTHNTQFTKKLSFKTRKLFWS